MIAIIDYGMGNLSSVKNALDYLGLENKITADKEEIASADRVILPGVGAFADAIATLREGGYDSLIGKIVADGKPLLGICLGYQLLFEKSWEFGEYDGLGLLPGEIKKLDVPLKIPHVGWNSLWKAFDSRLFKGVNTGQYVYFVHSYYLDSAADFVSCYTEYGVKFPVSIEKDNIFGVQFHPEKSGKAGLQILKNFGDMR
ncbi:MAG: imidazole glycerol phosphate synthase subunit HisH [Fusobacteriaceae bacterium]|jgi:glutamine amidotransferase|nr:imidazole glycerol phosphate synthase subunit HisH [Fusobacteriaceae bacterium]